VVASSASAYVVIENRRVLAPVHWGIGDDVMRRSALRPISAVGMVLALVTLGVSCGGDDNGKIGIELQEFKVIPDDDTAKTGKVEFEVENVGGTTHEFVVVRAKDAAGLPTKADGSVDEEQLEPENQIGELEDLEPKAKESTSFDLDPGSYVLFCNVVEEDVDPPISHFQKGMQTHFTVSE
jgi:hypothetical protein